MGDDQFEMPTPDPALKRLDFLVGKWELTGRSLDGPAGPGGEITGVETFEWMDGGFFLIHHWEGSFIVEGAPVVDTGYEFFDFDPATQKYRAHFFNNFGPYEENGSHYLGEFDGDGLVMTGPARILRRLNSDGTITVDSDISPDGESYLPFMRTTLKKA